MIAELADNHLCDQARPGDAARNRPWWKRSRTDAVFASTASVLGTHMDMSFQLGRLVLQFPRDVLADAVHGAATTRARLFLVVQVVIVDDFPELIPIDLAFPAAAMALHFGLGFLVRGGLVRGFGHR